VAEYGKTGRELDFFCTGVDVNTPVDRVKKKGKFPTLRNVMVTQDGTIDVRPGIQTRATAAGLTPWHSAGRLNDPGSIPMPWMMVHGIGGSVLVEQSAVPGTYTSVGSGYSGNPVSLTVGRPPRSPQAWMYVGDTGKMQKVRVSSLTAHSVGIPQPNIKPSPVADTGQFQTIDLFEAAAGWATVSGGAAVGAAALRVNTTTTAVKAYNSAFLSTAYVVRPASMANIGVGMILTCALAAGGTIDVLVVQVNKGSANTTTISNIVYDLTGVGTIAYLYLATPAEEVQPGSMIFNSTRNNHGVVNAVNIGIDGQMSLEVDTSASNWQAGDTVQLMPSFVVNFNASLFTAAGAITSNYVPFTTGAIGSSFFTRTVTLDLSKLNSAAGATLRATDIAKEMMHISLYVDKPDLVSEIKVYLDIDSVTNNFTQNFYIYSISQNDFTPVTKSTQSTIDNRQFQVRRRILDGGFRIPAFVGADGPGGLIDDPSGGLISEPGNSGDSPSRRQLVPGGNQYSEIVFPLGMMTKVGGDATRGFSDVKAIQIEVITTSASPVTVRADSWILHGGYEPDCTDLNLGYVYFYRYRVSSTGVVSDISPASTKLAFPRRQRVNVQIPGTSTPAEVDKIDIFRIGGTLDTICYVGTADNPGAGSTLSYGDVTSDVAARDNADADGTFDVESPDNQPWVVAGPPISGNTTNVCGTIIQSAAGFDTTLLRGTVINVGNLTTSIVRVVTSSLMELADNVGNAGVVKWEIPEPYRAGQPLLMFGPFDEYMFALKDVRNPGTLYYSKPGNPDSHRVSNRINITTGSEVLQNGFVLGSHPGVFSDRRLFDLNFDPGDPDGPWVPHPQNSAKGLYATWAMAVSRVYGVAWLATDGVYLLSATAGIRSLTDEDLYPLFSHGDKPGIDTNSISAPFMPNPVGNEEPFLRLCFGSDDSLYFFYRTASATRKVLRYDFTVNGWFPYDYAKALVFVYSEEGPGVKNLIAGSAETPNSVVYTVGGTTDDGTDAGTPVPCQVRTPSFDQGEPRSEKQYGDIVFDSNPDGYTLAVQPGFDNHTVTIAPTNYSGVGRTGPGTPIDLSSGSGQFARNISLDISWSTAASAPISRPRLYFWQPSVLPHPEQTVLRASDYDFTDGGMLYVRGFWVDANTFGVQRAVIIDYIDHNGAAQTFNLNVNHPVKSRIFYPVTAPFYLTTMRVRGNDSSKWRLYGVEAFGDKAPPFSRNPTEFTNDGEISNKFLQGGVVDIDTHGATVPIQVQGDLAAVLGTPSFTAAQRTELPFTLNPAKITHLMRLAPQANCHVFGVKWFWQHEAELAAYYESQSMAGELPGWKHAREAFIAYYGAASPITLAITTDAGVLAGIPTLPASATYTRQRILIPAQKFKWIQLTVTCASPFGLDREGCEVHMKAWAAEGDYQIWKPFGFERHDRGIAII
jgi:hypothetical protein